MADICDTTSFLYSIKNFSIPRVAEEKFTPILYNLRPSDMNGAA